MHQSYFPGNTEIVNLNVGGTRFSTSRQTLTWIPDTFFSSMLCGRMSSFKDDSGAIFIDRDPAQFSVILNYLRTKEIDLKDVDIHALRHEAEYYGIAPLLRRLTLCEDLGQSTCGGVLFHGIVPPPSPPFPAEDKRLSTTSIEAELHPAFRPPDTSTCRASPRPVPTHSRQGSYSEAIARGHSRTNSADLRQGIWPPASMSMSDLRIYKSNFPSHDNYLDPLRVTIVRGHFNWIAVAYPHFVSLYRLKESTGWILAWTSSYQDTLVERIALNAKVMSPGQDHCSRMVATSSSKIVQLWHVMNDDQQTTKEIGKFDLNVAVDSLFFIGTQLVALSHTGKVGVWHAMTQNWQIQDVVPITSFDTAGSFLLLGCNNGSIYYIDMQKFPLRMKDNDLLVTELYKDPAGDRITALSVYLTPKTIKNFAGLSGNWIEIAYGTSAGTVRVIVQHPETVGHGPQLFQTFTVHRSPVTKVMLSEKHLVSVCSEYNHVRSWSVTRFRGMISTQPGSMPLASFKIVSIEDMEPQASYSAGNDFGPFGEKDDQQVFVQKVIPETDQLFIRMSSTGQRVCLIKSVDGSAITAFCVHECEGSSRMGSRPRRYLFTGHSNGTIQMWDLSTAIDLINKNEEVCLDVGGPTPGELVRLLDQCDISNSRNTTPSVSPSPSLMAANQNSISTASLLPSGQHMTPSTQRRRGVGHDAIDHAHGPQAPPSSDGSSQMASF